MKCINHSHPEYKALNEVVNDKLLLDILINRWQEFNKSDEFPSVKDTKAFADKHNLNLNTTKVSPTNIVDAKKAIGIKNPGYGYSDLQKNMLLKRLKLYNLKNSTRHSVDIEKIGQANLYKIKFNYVPQVNIGFKKRDTGDSNQSTNVNPEVEELFETNPELANEVYKVLRFEPFKFEPLDKYSNLSDSTLNKKEEAVNFLQSLDGKKLFSPSEMLRRISNADTSRINKGLSDYLDSILEQYKGIYAEDSINPYRVEFKERLKLGDDRDDTIGDLRGYNQAGYKAINLTNVESNDLIRTILHEFVHDIEPYVLFKDSKLIKVTKTKGSNTSLTEEQLNIGNQLENLRKLVIKHLAEEFKNKRANSLKNEIERLENGGLITIYGELKKPTLIYINNLKDELNVVNKLIETNKVEDFIENNKQFFLNSEYNHYGVTKLNEFITEALTNDKFRNLLNEIPYKNTTILSYLFKLFQKILGIKKDTVLSETLNLVHKLATSKREQLRDFQATPQQKQQATLLYSQYLEQNPNGSIEQFKSWVDEFNRNNQKLKSNIQIFSGDNRGDFDSSSLKDDDLALMLFNQALGLNLTSVNQLTWDNIKDNIFFEKEDGSLGVKNLAFISGNFLSTKKATLSDFINQKGLFPEYKVFIGESVIYPNVFEALEENEIIKQAVFENLFNLSGAFEQVKKELNNHSPETFVIQTPHGKFTFPKRFASGFFKIASTVELLLKENQSSYIQDYLSSKRKKEGTVKDGKKVKPIITQTLTVNDTIVQNAIGLIGNSIIENAIKNNTSVKIQVFSNAEYSEDGVAGWYITTENTIYLHESMLSPQHLSEGLPLIAHELLHSVTSQSLLYDEEFSKSIRALLKIVKDKSNIKDFYGFKNEHEFLSEAFSSQEFRQLLKNTKFEGIEELSIWQKFINAILKLFGKNVKYTEKSTLVTAEEILNDIINDNQHKIQYIKSNILDKFNTHKSLSDFITQKSTNVKPTIDLSKEWSGDLKTRPVYTPEGVNTMRTESAKPNEHFGNPFSASGYSNTIKVPSVQTAVKAYKDWLLTGYATWLDENGDVEDFAGNQEQRKWILDQINQGKLDGATLLYAGKLAARGEGMHPTALVEVVDQLRSNQQSTSVKPNGTINVYWGQPESATSTKVLSNLAPRKFTYQGKEYGSVEHAYQTLKSGTFDPDTYAAYVKVGGYGTKIRGKAIARGFDNLQLMRNLVVESFKQNSNSQAAKKLLQYENFTHNTNEIIDKAFLEGLKLAQQALLSNQPSTAVELTPDEIFTQDQLKTITEQLAYVVLSKVDTLEASTEVDYSIIDDLLESLNARAIDDEDLELSNRISNVVDNLDMFKERVKTYIKDFGFTESEEDVEDEDGNIVPINVLNVSDLKDAPSRVKLLVALLPSQDRNNSYLGLPKMVNFQEAWNDLKYAIADLPATHPDGDVVDGLEAIEGKLYELSKYKPHFRILADKLISPNTSDQLRTQFYNTFTGTKINYSTTLINRQDGQMSVKIIDSDIQASDKLIRNEWNANFVDNIGIYDQMTLFHKPEEVKIVKDLANAFSVSIKKDIKSKTLSKESLNTFRQLLNKIGVTISTDALKSAIEAQNKESEALNLYSLMFDPKTGLYNGIKAIVDKSGQPFFTKNKTFRSEILNQDAFLELAKHEAKFRSDLGQSQILGPEGNAFGLFSKHNALTQILSDYKSNPEALKALENSSYTKNTRWGKWMLKDKANAKAFNVVILNNYKQEFGGDKGTSPSELKPGDTLTNVVNRTLKGNYIGLAEADKNNQSTFVGPKPEESHVRGDLTYMYLENDNAVDILMDYLADEINRIADVHDQLFGENKIALDRQIQHYHYAKVFGDNEANGLKLYILPELDLNSFGLLYNSGKPMPLNSDNFYNNTALREYVKEAFLTAVKKDVSKLIEVGVLNSDFTNNSIDSAVINKYSHPYKVFNTVGDFTLNSIIANVEQTKLFNCDPAMYKTDKLGNLFTDISKRVPALTAQGTSPMVYSDNLGNQVVKPTYTSAVIDNIETPSKYFINDKGEVKPEIIDEIYKAINSDLNYPKVSKESIETSLKGYKKVNRTDAQAWITIDLYRQRLLSFGQWDMKVHEPIFEDIKAGRPITAEHMLLFAQPLKTVHVERKFQDGVFVLHYNKQSEAVLHPFLVKDLALNNLLTAMKNSKTDHVITLDGKKVGASGTVKITDKKGNILPSSQIQLNNVTLSTRFVLLQQDLRRKGVKQTLVASQAPKVTFADVQLSENYIVDGEKLTGEEAVIALHNVTSELSDMGLSDLKQELQVNKDGSVNDAAFRAKLIKDLEDSDASDNILEALKEGLPIDAIPGLRNTAQSKAMAMTRTAAVKLKQLGASLIQMSDFGFTGVAGTDVNTSIIWFKDPSTELLPTRLVKGKIRPSQVLIPYNLVSKIPGWKSMTPEQLKEAIDPECLRGFSYRIPNQGHSSNDVFEIVGILPESCGDVMIAYGEITKKTGSDFDIDKNYIMLPNVEFDKASGKLRKIKYNPNRSKNDPYYKAALENRRLDLMSGLLGDPKTYLSNVSPLDNPWLVDLCAELFPATSTNTNLDFFTGTYQANIKSLYDNAKSLVGVIANQLSDHGVAQLEGLLLKTPLKKGVPDKSTGLNRLSTITGETGILISTILNAYANGILDAAKDPYITRANINQQTSPVAFMLIRAGVDPNWVVAFIGQPIIKKLIAETAKTESKIYVKKRDKDGNGKVITPIDLVLEGYKLPENVGAYNISLDTLTKIIKGERSTEVHPESGINYTKLVELEILKLFLEYQKIAKNLSASIRASKQDVNGGGKSLNYARALNNDLINIINSGEIINLDKKIGVVVEDGEVVVEDGLPVMDKSRMVSTYHENSVNQSIIMFSNMFITQSPAFISTMNSVLTMQGIEFSTFNIDLIDKISNNVYSYLLSHPLSGISKQAYDNLFFGDNSIAVRIKNIKNSKGKLAANLLIENMKYDIAYTATDPSFVGLNNAKQLSKQSKDALYLAWEELATTDRKLAEDLVKYSYYSSGFSKTLTSFYEHIPISLLKSMDFTTFIKGIASDLYNDGYLYKAGNQIIKNLHGSTELVPTLPFVDPYGAFNTDYIFVLGKKLKDQYKISDVTETHAEHKRFVKFNNNLYELAGYTTSGDDPVYVRTNKLSYSDKGNIIKEYFFDSNSNVSIIPDNNVSLPVEIAAVVGDPSKITPPTIVTKLKTIAIKPSTASLDEAEIERIAKEKQKEC